MPMSTHDSFAEDRIAQVRRNLGLLIDTLRIVGYEFVRPSEVWIPPDSEVEAKLAVIEKSVGTVPQSLAEFYRQIGSVDPCGQHCEWTGGDCPDPFVVLPIEAVLVDLRDWEQNVEEFGRNEVGPFELPVSMDDLHKENVSGGPCYSLKMPCGQADPALCNIWYETTFLGYVETSLRWGGFPGLSRSPEHTWPLEELRAALSGRDG